MRGACRGRGGRRGAVGRCVDEGRRSVGRGRRRRDVHGDDGPWRLGEGDVVRSGSRHGGRDAACGARPDGCAGRGGPWPDAPGLGCVAPGPRRFVVPCGASAAAGGRDGRGPAGAPVVGRCAGAWFRGQGQAPGDSVFGRCVVLAARLHGLGCGGALLVVARAAGRTGRADRRGVGAVGAHAQRPADRGAGGGHGALRVAGDG